jgi:hypothetical protein
MISDETSIALPGDWFQVDFHVHSPGSFDFQGNGKDEAGYIWLLEQAKAAEIDIVVITDHNDIAGYTKLREIEDDLRRTKRTLERTNSELPESAFAPINSQIALFDEVVILPGVELDVYPNIHLVVVFDPEKTNEIPNFLDSAGYTIEVRGEESSSRFAKWNLEQALQEAEKIGALVIAAHVDSDKGLYEASKKWGQNRINAFCDENLYGMEFINPIARDQIENILKSPGYARNTRLAFVQSSDFHGKPEQKIGERRTFVRMDNVEKKDKNNVFQTLKKNLRNPDEFVSAPGRPELKAILAKLADKPAIESIESDPDKIRLLQWVCAYANTEDGTITIGRNSKRNWIGQTEISGKEFEKKVRSIISSGISPIPSYALQVYPYYGNNYIATIRVGKQKQMCALSDDDRIYVLKSGEPKQASSKEIIDLVESRFIERYSHLSITNRLAEMSQKLLGMEDSLDILPLVRRIDNNSLPLSKVLRPPEHGAILNDVNQSTLDIPGNGYTDGNVIALTTTRPRFNKHYLRFSAPIGRDLSKPEKHFDEKTRFKGEKIIVVPGGGVHYDNHDDIFIACTMYTPLVFTGTRKNIPFGLKFITAYLKSSVAIWYADRCLGSCDIRRLELGLKLPVPNVIDKTCQDEAENLVDKLLSLEYEFLNTEKEYIQAFSTKESRESTDFLDGIQTLIEKHNSAADKIIGQIDELFYDLFKFSSREIDLIEKGLQSANIANFIEAA